MEDHTKDYLKHKLQRLEKYLGKAEDCLWHLKGQLTEDHQKKDIDQLYALTNAIAVNAYKICNVELEE